MIGPIFYDPYFFPNDKKAGTSIWDKLTELSPPLAPFRKEEYVELLYQYSGRLNLKDDLDEIIQFQNTFDPSSDDYKKCEKVLNSLTPSTGKNFIHLPADVMRLIVSLIQEPKDLGRLDATSKLFHSYCVIPLISIQLQEDLPEAFPALFNTHHENLERRQLILSQVMKIEANICRHIFSRQMVHDVLEALPLETSDLSFSFEYTTLSDLDFYLSDEDIELFKRLINLHTLRLGSVLYFSKHPLNYHLDKLLDILNNLPRLENLYIKGNLFDFPPIEVTFPHLSKLDKKFKKVEINECQLRNFYRSMEALSKLQGQNLVFNAIRFPSNHFLDETVFPLTLIYAQALSNFDLVTFNFSQRSNSFTNKFFAEILALSQKNNLPLNLVLNFENGTTHLTNDEKPPAKRPKLKE